MFVDTNVLVFATVTRAPLHQTAEAVLERLNATGATLSISRQVIREFLAVLTRPGTYHRPTSADEAVAAARDLEAKFTVLEDGPAVTDRLLALVRQVPTGGRQVHDANIVATMLVHGVRRLLTHNVGDFTRFSGLIDVEPLVRP